MNKLLIAGVTGLIIISIETSLADNIRITAIDESPSPASLTISSSMGRNQTVSLNRSDVKMFTAEYKYPAPIFIQANGQVSKCDWSMPLVGKQTIQMLSINISKNPSTNTLGCLITRQQ